MAQSKDIARYQLFALLLIAGAACWSSAATPPAVDNDWHAADSLAAACANLSASEVEKLRQSGGLLDVRPVALPRGEWLYRDPSGTPLTHLGWPVAVKQGNVVLVFYSRMFSHSRGPNPLSVVRGCAVARSLDSGETFQPVPTLKDSCLDTLGITTGHVDTEYLSRADWQKDNAILNGAGPVEQLTNMQGGSGPNAAGVIDSHIVVATSRGVYRSSDNGDKWTRLEGAGMPAQIPTFPRWGQGPELLVHPEHGLVSLGATTEGELLIRTSGDHGQTWRESRVDVGEPIQEPAGLFYEGRLLLMPRTERATKRSEPGAQAYYQYVFDTGMTRFTKQLTTILAGERDTTDVKYNPVSGRIEALVTNRLGGGPGNESDNCMSLNLWSIAPDDFLAGSGEWLFDGTLLRSEGREHDRDNTLGLERDGMCPGGTVFDTESGVQYIYVYMGHFTGPTGVFQIRRSLDTERLRDYLLAGKEF